MAPPEKIPATIAAKTEQPRVLTCSTCGHRGEDSKDYQHDCYWVMRDRIK